MKSIEIINFISLNNPNLVLIASIYNELPTGIALKYFQSTHNIYAIHHQAENGLEFYNDLPSKHSDIEEILNEYRLHKFFIFPLSFGTFLAYYLMFHFSNRVDGVFIHDFLPHSCQKPNLFYPNISIANWNIPKICHIPVLLSFHRGAYITKAEFNDLKAMFTNFNYVLYTSEHTLKYNLTKWISLLFLFFNGFSIKTFWGQIFVDFFHKKPLSISPEKSIFKKAQFKLFCLLNYKEA